LINFVEIKLTLLIVVIHCRVELSNVHCWAVHCWPVRCNWKTKDSN